MAAHREAERRRLREMSRISHDPTSQIQAGVRVKRTTRGTGIVHMF
jgi:hypothetical protein